ncbi:MAG: phage portal protein, partial [Turicibacter sp.]|nr:phage portal protein [Turicibacter sp.]
FWDFLMEDKKNEKTEERSLTRQLNIGLHGFLSGVSDDMYTAEQILSIPVAKACCDLIVNSIKSLPIELYERVDDNTVRQITDDYRVNLLNNAPNIIATGADFKEKIIRDLVLHGNAYVDIERDGNNIVSLWNIDASDVGISKYSDREKPHIVKDVKFKIYSSNVELNLDDVMILTESSEDGGLTGQGVIARGYRTIELALNEIELNKNIMNNGSSPISVVKLDKNLSAEAQQRLRDSWTKMYASSQNAGKLLILEQGMEYEKLSFSPAELGLSASRSKTQTELCSLFGVPESMIDSTANTYGNVENSSIRFLQYSITPHINVIEASLNRSLLLEKEKNTKFFKINTDSVLQTTQKERYEALNVGISSGILSLNEARIKENLPPIDDNFHRLSLGSVMYDPKDRIYFIPNMSTVIDAETKHIISSPNLPVGGAVENVPNGQQKEIDAKEKVDDKDE